MRRFEVNGQVEPASRGRRRVSKVDQDMVDYLIGKVSENLVITLKTLKEQMHVDLPTTTTTVYFNEVVFPSVLGSTSPMAFPQHSPPPSPVPSIFPTKSLLSHIFSQHFSPSLPGSTFHSITIYLKCLNSLYPTQIISPLNMTKPPQPVSSHHFTNVINCQLTSHPLITFTFT